MRGSFYGWYLKCQSDTQTLAVIPAVHRVGQKRTCSMQIITNDEAWTVPFLAEEFQHQKSKILIGRNRFDATGIGLAVDAPEVTAVGKLSFGQLSPLRYDIMGPFALVPFMECRHSVWSMRHSVNGTVYINGQKYCFENALGYWEGDRGCSFPKEYAWTQCLFPGGSLMLAVADIPMAGIHFTGIIGVVLWRGKEYRLATYLGARAVEIRNGRIRIVQGGLELEARLLETRATGQSLRAPVGGEMGRTIRESAACRAFYCLRKKGHTLMAFETTQASFEYEYPFDS